MESFPHYPTRAIRRLDGIWDFCYAGDDVDLDALNISALTFEDRLAVPGCFDACPAYAGKRGTGVYRRTVDVTPQSRGLLHLAGLGMWYRILVDGKVLHQGSLPYTGFTVEVPPAAHRRRDIAVVVDNRFDRSRVPLMDPFFDFYCYGGIYRSVTWHELHEGAVLDRVAVFTEDLEQGLLRLRVQFRDPVTESLDLAVQFDDEAPQELHDLRPEDGVVTLRLRLDEATPWTPDDPVLHTCRVTCGPDAVVERFGLRTVGVRDGMVTVNGQPLKLLGYCRHEAHPQYGPALPLQQLVQDLQLLRDLGCTIVRGSHYPQDPRFLDLCDEMGMLVFEESLGWGQQAEHFTDPAFCRAQVEQTRRMVAKSINHPSVILWGFLNEGASHTEASHELYRSLAGAIRDSDPSRLVTYATNHPFDDVNLDLVDVVSVNTYPGWYAQNQEQVAPSAEIVPRIRAVQASLAARGQGDKPLILSEIGAGAIYGWRDALQAHWSEEYQQDYLQIVCDEVCSNPALAGVTLWQFCDCRTYAGAMALRRPRAFNNKGTLDEYRRPKLAYNSVRDCFRACR